jgi:dTMP kinase
VAGVFVVIEGPDGAGKTTLTGRLAERFRAAGHTPVMVREPGGTPVAEAARAVFLDPSLKTSAVAELFLVLAARADLVQTVIRPALSEGRVVICERFDLSTEAYQIAGRGLDREAVLAANRLATGGLRPNLLLVLDLPAKLGLERQRAGGKAPDRIELADADLHQRVAEVFLRAAGDEVVHLDATGPADDLERAAWEVVRARLGETITAGTG